MSVLLPQHEQQLQASGLTPEVIEARGYRSVTKKSELRGLGFGDQQARVPALLIPVWNVLGEVGTYQTRPDQPRVDAEGKLIKYETPGGSRMVVDVPPAARQWLGDPLRPLFVTEGVKKADAMVAADGCCLALLGVWNWRGTNALGGRTVLPDFDSIAFNGRQVFLAFDSDVMLNMKVYRALLGLRKQFELRGAEVLQVYLEPGPGGQKTGLDDFLAGGKRLRDVLSLATPELRPIPGDEQQRSKLYEDTPSGLLWHRQTERGTQRVQLTNFRAWIVADVRQDDGEDVQTVFEVEAKRNGHSARFLVPAQQFDSLEWARKHLGAEAIIYAGQGIKDHARVAMTELSIPIPRRVQYTHLGWRQLNEEWIYLHTNGAISKDGDMGEINVEPPRGLTEYRLPPPPDLTDEKGREETRTAVRRSLAFLDVAPRAQTWPLLAAVYTAPFASLLPADFVMWVYGESQGRKSTAAAIVLNHFGDFDRNRLPANFRGTANGLEIQLFSAKDALLVVDDFCPGNDQKEAARQEAVCHRLIRDVGDSSGRARATIDGRLQATRVPRCLALATAELPPPGGQSSQARTVEVEWRKELVQLERLSHAEEQDRPQYRLAMAAYLQYLAPQMPRLKKALPALVRKVRNLMPGEGRPQEAVAKLYCGVGGFLNFAHVVGAITAAELRTLDQEACEILGQCASRTGGHQRERKPSQLFLEYVRALLATGEGFLADPDTGEAPQEDASRWGFAPPRGNDHYPQPRSGADKLGWVDPQAGEVWLLPAASHRAVTRYADGANVFFAASVRALSEALAREGLLVRVSGSRPACSVRAEGGKHWVWVVSLPTLFGEEDASAPAGAPITAEKTGPQGGCMGGGGVHSGGTEATQGTPSESTSFQAQNAVQGSASVSPPGTEQYGGAPPSSSVPPNTPRRHPKPSGPAKYRHGAEAEGAAQEPESSASVPETPPHAAAPRRVVFSAGADGPIWEGVFDGAPEEETP